MRTNFTTNHHVTNFGGDEVGNVFFFNLSSIEKNRNTHINKVLIQ
jgi:hypothetical protein